MIGHKSKQTQNNMSEFRSEKSDSDLKFLENMYWQPWRAVQPNFLLLWVWEGKGAISNEKCLIIIQNLE